MGLMPSHRGGERAAWALKAICIFPDNPKRGLDAHQGGVALFSGETGELLALLQRLRGDRDPHRRGLGGRDARAGTGGRERLRDPRLRRPGPLARRGDAERRPRLRRDPHLEPHAENARRCAEETGADRGRLRRGGARRRRRRLHDDHRPRADRAPRVARARRARERGRLEHPDRRASSTPRRSPTRRSSSTGASRPRTRPATTSSRCGRARSAPTTSAPSSATSCSAPHPGRGSRRRADRVQVARDRRRGPRLRRARVPPRAGAGRSASRSSSDPARRDRGRARDDRRRGRPDAAAPAAGCPSATAEIWLKLENLQPIGSFKIRGATNAIRQRAAPRRSRAGVVTASAGNMAQGVAWAAREAGVPCTVVVPEHAPQTKLDAIERLGGRTVKVPFERWWRRSRSRAYRRRRGAVRPPGRGRARDGRQRDDRARAARGPAGPRTRSSCRSAAAGS